MATVNKTQIIATSKKVGHDFKPTVSIDGEDASIPNLEFSNQSEALDNAYLHAQNYAAMTRELGGSVSISTT
jgi:hypothetical protein